MNLDMCSLDVKERESFPIEWKSQISKGLKYEIVA